MVEKKSFWKKLGVALAIVLTVFTHWVVYYFIILNSGKSKNEAAELSLQFPKKFQFIENYKYVLQYRNGMFLQSLWNSIKLTVCVITVLVLVASMAAYILQRRGGWLTKISNKLILAGLIVPLSVIPTYWVLTKLHLAGSLPGLALVEIATMFAFSTMLYKGYIASLPADIDEAAIMEGCSLPQLFFKIIFPLLQPITVTIIILKSVDVYNDFYNPLYFMSGSKNTTIQLCIYLFQSSFMSEYEHLFAGVVLGSLPPLILFLFLSKKIIGGMTMGSVKG